MTDEMLVSFAKEEGFTNAAVIDTEKIVFDASFRPYCAENLCGKYGFLPAGLRNARRDEKTGS